MSIIAELFAGSLKNIPDKFWLTFSIGLVTVILFSLYHKLLGKKLAGNVPPMVPFVIPFLGSMVSFGMHPIQFLAKNREKYGDTYTFLMFGKRMTYLFGPDGNNFALNTCKLKEVSAEEAYKYLTTPVFGEGVVYDVPNHVLVEQKKFIKHGLSPENLRVYVQLIEEETNEYFKRWNKAEGEEELFHSIAELTIMTASRCLMGKEIRAQLDETVAKLYNDLDKGFTPLNFLFPSLPLPSYRNRDIAHAKMRNLFLNIMKERRENNEMNESDMLTALMDSEYRDGRKLTDREAACLMIALLMAGQHTSSTTGTWCLSYLADNPECRKKLMTELKSLLGEDLSGSLDYETLKSMTYLDNCIRETLRLRPPIITLMRKAMATVEYNGFTIPEGDFICVSPALGQLDEKVWGPDALVFNPDRFYEGNPYLNGAMGHGACSSYLPFGAGRHRCIGEAFAYVQLKTIIVNFAKTFDFEFPPSKKFPATDFTTLIAMPITPVTIKYKRWKLQKPSFRKEE